MGVADVAEVLEANPGTWMSINEIKAAIPTMGGSAVAHAIKSVVKREDYEIKIIAGRVGHMGTQTRYRYKETR